MIVQIIDDWQARATRIQSEQPHGITPLVTVTPRLEQEFRYDQFWQANQNGLATDNFGGSKGLELIPFQNTEVILGIPPWIAHNGSIRLPTKKKSVNTDGWGDQTFLLKYRLLSANEENGNYIVTAFMGFSAPTGDDGNSAGHGLFTPTIAGGKGFGDFSVQSTLGITFPSGGEDRLGGRWCGIPRFNITSSSTFGPKWKPITPWFAKGERTGQNQLFLTPALLLGRFPIRGRLGLTWRWLPGRGHERSRLQQRRDSEPARTVLITHRSRVRRLSPLRVPAGPGNGLRRIPPRRFRNWRGYENLPNCQSRAPRGYASHRRD